MLHRMMGLDFRSKIVALCVFVAVTASALHGVFSYRDIAELSRIRAIELLGSETRLNGSRLARSFHQMEQDAAVLAGTPPVGAILAIQSGHVADVEGDGLDVWRRRLEVIFRAQLSVRPHYFQVRLIGEWSGGREIVRLDATDGVIGAMPPERLQQKGSEDYMRPFLEDAPPGAPFFSDLSRNRENGVLQPDAPWTIRLVHPVAGTDGRVRGAIVINADYSALIDLAELHVQDSGVVVTDFDADSHVAVMVGDEFADDAARDAAKAGALEADRIDTVRLDDMRLQSDAEWTKVTVEESLPALSGEHRIAVASAMPTSVLMRSARATLRHQLLLSVLVLVLTTAIASVFAIGLARPLRDLTERIAKHRRLEPIELDTSARDEIGRLARAFTEMSNDLIMQVGQARHVFDYAVDGLLTCDQKGRIIEMNPAAYRIFGYAPGSLTGQPVSRLMPEEIRPRHEEYLHLLGETRNEHPMSGRREVDGLRADGQAFALEIRISQVATGGESVSVAVLRDISQRRAADQRQRNLIAELEGSNIRLSEANEELARAKTELERSNAELDKFAYVASHDLRAPLRVIDNASRWLEEDLAEYLDDDTRESMELLRNRVGRMERLLQDLLEHSRIGRVSESDTLIDGPELVENILALTAKPDGFAISVGEGFASLRLPQFPIQTVLVNLVSNAVKHHDRADGHVALNVEEAGDHFVFEVTDDGPGIAPEFHEKIFDMFQTLRPRDEVEGSGMGLAIVKKTVEVAGGGIALVSTPGAGSRFRVTWPKSAADMRIEEAAA